MAANRRQDGRAIFRTSCVLFPLLLGAAVFLLFRGPAIEPVMDAGPGAGTAGAGGPGEAVRATTPLDRDLLADPRVRAVFDIIRKGGRCCYPRASRAAEALGPSLVDKLLPILRHGDDEMQLAAMYLVPRRPSDRRVVMLLCDLVSDPEESDEVRKEALRALERMEPGLTCEDIEGLLPLFRKLALDRSLWRPLRYAALDQICEHGFGPDCAHPSLEALLALLRDHEDHECLRLEAAERIQELFEQNPARPLPVDALVEAMRNPREQYAIDSHVLGILRSAPSRAGAALPFLLGKVDQALAFRFEEGAWTCDPPDEGPSPWEDSWEGANPFQPVWNEATTLDFPAREAAALLLAIAPASELAKKAALVLLLETSLGRGGVQEPREVLRPFHDMPAIRRALDDASMRGTVAEVLRLSGFENERTLAFLADGARSMDRDFRLACTRALAALTPLDFDEGEETARARPKIALLAEKLLDADEEVRRSAAWLFHDIESEDAAAPLVQPALERALGDRSERVRVFVAWGLRDLAPEKAFPVLAGLVRSPRTQVRQWVARCLCYVPEEELAPFFPLLADKSRDVRYAALLHFSTFGSRHPGALPVFLRLLGDPEPPIRALAASAVAASDEGLGRSRPRLAALLSDPDPDVRRAVRQILD